jgi:hypothetical protein
VLSHRSAAALWGMRDTARANAEITAPRQRRPRGTPGARARQRSTALIADRRITDTLTRRDLEDRLTLLDAEDLPRPLVNSEINLAPRTKPETGFRWPHHNLVVELDGY